MSNPTPSSEIIHLVSTFVDTLDALPPSLTRSLSDLKELDAVLSGSLQSITTKLQLLLTMLNTPPPGSVIPEGTQAFTPFERLKLLREVTEDARVFRLGGEDKIRVATGTCETIATHTSHLSTLSTLLLSFLPSHLLPMLPPPSAPHGYPSSITPSSALARRQIFDYPTANHAGSGSTTRMQGALGMVREHWDMTRGAGSGRDSRVLNTAAGKRKPTMGMGGGGGMMSEEKHMMQTGLLGRHQHQVTGGMLDKDKGGMGEGHRHPNQYTKKKLQQQQQQHPYGGQHSHNASSNQQVYASASASHSSLNQTLESSKDKRRSDHSHSSHAPSATNNNTFASSSTNSGATRGNANSTSAAGGMSYAGMASQEEYNAATLGAGGARNGKRKGEGDAGNGKRRKKGPDISPDPTARSMPVSAAVAALKAPRRATAVRVEEALPPIEALPLEEEGGEVDEDGDGQTYCFCNRVSFGEMIGCDGNDCEREWFHLPCVGLQAIPKGQWFCTECQKAKRRR